MKDEKKKKDNGGLGFYANHEGINFGIGLGNGMFLNSDGIHFGGLKL